MGVNFYAHEVGIPYRCPECEGIGYKPYSFYPCDRCQGTGHFIRVMLTYPESLDTGGSPTGRWFFAGYIWQPKQRLSEGRATAFLEAEEPG